MRRTVVPSLLLAVLAALCALAAACAPPPRVAVSAVWPGAAWEAGTPESEGVHPGRLADLLERVEAEGLHLHALLVVRGGRLVHESYAWPFTAETRHDIASCTKSVTALLAGAAIADGRLPGVDARMVDLLPGRTLARRSAHKEAITLRHLLTMTSGLETVTHPGEQTLLAMLAAPDWVQFAAERRLERAAGDRWSYDSAGTHLLAASVAAAVGQDLAAYARDRLFAPIGVGAFEWPADPQGLPHGWGDLRLAPRDMARVGLLMLRQGRWDGRAVLPAEWVAAATRDQTGRAEGAPAGGYGYLWWGAPDGAFYAAGRGGQHIFVAPALDLVVVTTAGEGRAGTSRFGALLEQHLLPAVHPDGPRSADAAGPARLAAVVARRAAPPAPVAPSPVPAAAAAALRLSAGLSFADGAPFGWQALRLALDGPEGRLVLTVAGREERFAVGLDGVPRLTEGARLTDLPRHEGGSVALAARWQDDETLVLAFDTLARIDRGTATIHLPAGKAARVVVVEETQGFPPVEVPVRP
jgi:CubicO group peptidase (beta-lactamase class C family)